MSTESSVMPTLGTMTADQYAEQSSRRRRKYLIGGVVLSALSAGAFLVGGIDNIALPLILLVCLVVPVTLWRYPRAALYITFIAACMIELFPSGYSDAITDRLPFFWDINTILQANAHVNFKAIPFNVFEVFIIVAALCSLFRSVFTGTARLKAGALIVPIGIYLAFVAYGWGVGLTTGGDFKISLEEVRAQVYFLLAYLMTVNLVQEKRQVGTLLWMTAICIGIKGILYTFRRYVTLHGMPVPDQGVGSHEEAFFFDAFAVLLVVLVLCRWNKKLQWVMVSLLPFVVLGNLATNRRAATAALVVIIPLLLLSAYRVFPERRKLIAIAVVVLTILGGIYYAAFKNTSGMLGEPARAIHSAIAPDPRDESSDAYRIAENADLMATIKSAPLGYGYGKPMLHAVPIADISAKYAMWDIMTHNQILWVWMRVGTLGFIAFWMMVSAIIIKAGQLIRREDVDPETKVVGIFAMIVIAMLMIFGLLDLQLSNARDMIFAGVLSALVVVAGTLPQYPVDGPASGKA